MRKILRSENGQVLVITLLCMGILMGAMGLAIDVGVLFRARRNMQIAADAAAMAGATALFYGQGVTAAANAAAKTNGVDPSVTGNTVIVTQGPALGGAPCPSCVQVQLAKPSPTIFMSTFSAMIHGGDFSSINVSAKAIAGAPTAGKACVYIMNPSASKALQIHGSGSINMPDCGVYVNSNNKNDALCVTGSAGKSTFPWIDVVGQQPTNGNCGGSLNSTTAVNLGSPVQTDPFGNITGPVPDASGNCPSGTITDTTTTSIGGSYNSSGGATVCFTNPITLNAGASLGGGFYVFENGLTIGKGTVTVGTTTNGATLDVYGGTYSQDTASALTIYAPADTSNPYNAIAIMQPSNNTNPMSIQFGSSGAVMDGMIYAPGAFVTLHDEGGGGVFATGVVADTM